MRLTPSQLETLRSQPQSTELSLSIFEPQAIFKASAFMSGPGLKGSREIFYFSVTLGSYTAIESGFTMWVGSTPGAYDLGKIRVRSATASQIIVSENSIDWGVDPTEKFLTIFRYVDLWPIYPRIINDPNNIENTLWYKDYDIAYTNQNSILGTYVNMGPHRAIKRDPASGLAQLYYSSTGSFNCLGDTLNYNWFFEGATVTGSSVAVPGWITYDHPGNFTTRLVISGSSGGIDTSYRYVTIDPPEHRWQLLNFSGSRGEGGYTASIKVFDTIPIQEHAVVVLYKKSFYGSVQTNLGGNFPNAGDIFFVGHVDVDSISYDYEHSEVTFDVQSMSLLMKGMSGFSVSVHSVASPAYWYELLDMDSRRALYHYLRWHTTAMMISDFQFVGTDYKIQYFDSDRESMYDALDNYMRDTLLGKVVADRQGKVWLEVDARAYSNPTGTFTATMDITNRDWIGQPTIEERLSEEVSFIEMGGVAYSGVTANTFEALLAAAPGNVPGFHGSIENHEGLALGSQSQLNSMIGNVLANKNSPFPSIDLEMGILATNLDIAPQEALGLHIAEDDTIRNLVINGLYIPESMSWKYDSKGFLLNPQIEFRQLVNGLAGDTVTIPTTPDSGEGGGFGGGFSVPGLQIPPLATLFPPATGGSSTGGVVPALANYATYIGTSLSSTIESRGITLLSSLGAKNCTFTIANSGPHALFITAQWSYVAGGTAQPLITTSTRTFAIESTVVNSITSVSFSVMTYLTGGTTVTFSAPNTGLGDVSVTLIASLVRISA